MFSLRTPNGLSSYLKGIVSLMHFATGRLFSSPCLSCQSDLTREQCGIAIASVSVQFSRSHDLLLSSQRSHVHSHNLRPRSFIPRSPFLDPSHELPPFPRSVPVCFPPSRPAHVPTISTATLCSLLFFYISSFNFFQASPHFPSSTCSTSPRQTHHTRRTSTMAATDDPAALARRQKYVRHLLARRITY